MKIIIKLNDMNYRYDVYQMFNLYYGLNDIIFSEKDWCYEVDITLSSVSIRGSGERYEYSLLNATKIREGIRRAIFIFLKRVCVKELPWGTLIGIRPSKIALQLLLEGKDENEIIDYYSKHYFVREDKARLCISVAETEKKMVNSHSELVSVYIGMPFCPTRCMYCSFASNPINSCGKLVKPYLDALKTEISSMGRYIKDNNLKVQCVYFGGGTPTSVSDDEFEDVMKLIYGSFIENNYVKEFTVECGRPDSITREKLLSMKRYCVGRISINPQTMNNDTLKSIGRLHSAEEITEKFYLARNLGFDNINMDLIVGLPGEGIHEIEKTCDEILKLKPDNLTIHGLCVKRGSKMHENIINKLKMEDISQDEVNKMYEKTAATAYELGMKPYYMYKQKNMVGNMENVGYALQGKEGLYNIEMIEERQTIIAVGADAVTKVVFLGENRLERFPNVKDVNEYVSRIDEMIDKKVKLLDSLYKLY
jgi:coproporphyrinogen dehydrogenase HemZ